MLKVSFVMLVFGVYFKKHWLTMSKGPEIRSQVAKTGPCWKEIRDSIAIQFETWVQSIITNITKSYQINIPIELSFLPVPSLISFWNKVTMAICFLKKKSNSLLVPPKNRFHIIPPLGMNEVSPTCSRRSGGSSLNKRRAGRSRFHLAQKSSSWCLSGHIPGKRRWGLGERGKMGLGNIKWTRWFWNRKKQRLNQSVNEKWGCWSSLNL